MTAISRIEGDQLQEAVSGQVAIVTGGARGIGLATASLLIQHGARVVVVDVLEEMLKKACSTLGPQAAYRRCDVSDWAQQVELFDWVSQTYGRIDIVICNAAINPEIALLQTPEGDKRQEMASQVGHNYLADEKDGLAQLRPPSTRLTDINVNSVIFGLKLGIHHMKNCGGGRIIITGSAASYVPVASQPLYTASKHAVVGLMRSTAQIEEVARSGISISMVAPWLTVTSMVEGLDALHQPGTLKSSPNDVAAAIAYAAAAENTNGKCFWIQGQKITEVEESYGRFIQQFILPVDQA